MFEYDFRTSYTGATVARPEVHTALDRDRGIALEPDFEFVGAQAGVGSGTAAGGSADGPCAWLAHFWVPVPLALFARAGRRSFVCRARVTIGGWAAGGIGVDVCAGAVTVGIESLKTPSFLGERVGCDAAAAVDARVAEREAKECEEVL